MIKYIKFTEFNDWEGETWHFYIPLVSDLLPKIDRIRTILNVPEFKKLHEDEFKLKEEPITEKKAVAAVRDQGEDCGYMWGHNLVKDIKLPEKIDWANIEDLAAIFYKGGCFVTDKTAYPKCT